LDVALRTFIAKDVLQWLKDGVLIRIILTYLGSDVVVGTCNKPCQTLQWLRSNSSRVLVMSAMPSAVI
jgi:hypothetical protein